jgi:starch-binding outer membrane protein, SusD/RagB family
VNGGTVAPGELLRHERRVNLFLQGRRLADHYRFAEPSERWQPASDAARAPGTLLPIAQIERLSNCHIVGTCR